MELRYFDEESNVMRAFSLKETIRFLENKEIKENEAIID